MSVQASVLIRLSTVPKVAVRQCSEVRRERSTESALSHLIAGGRDRFLMKDERSP